MFIKIDDDALYTRREVEEYLRFSRATIDRMQRRGELLGHKVSGSWRFFGRDIKRCLERAREPEMADAVA